MKGAFGREGMQCQEATETHGAKKSDMTTAEIVLRLTVMAPAGTPAAALASDLLAAALSTTRASHGPCCVIVSPAIKRSVAGTRTAAIFL